MPNHLLYLLSFFIFFMSTKPTLFTSLSPALLHLYEPANSVIVIIDVFRATSTIAAALHNGAKSIIPVDSVEECIKIGKQLDAITAGERDGKVAEGLAYGNSPAEYPKEFIDGKTLVLTTTNGTKLLHMALQANVKTIITGSFVNIDAVCNFIQDQNSNVIMGCAGWKDKFNMEDTLFAGAVVEKVKNSFEINCDSSLAAMELYEQYKPNLFENIKRTSHYKRLSSYGADEDMRFCLSHNIAPSLPLYNNGLLING
jgi:2-phosphosulfolactate phosphatase